MIYRISVDKIDEFVYVEKPRGLRPRIIDPDSQYFDESIDIVYDDIEEIICLDEFSSYFAIHRCDFGCALFYSGNISDMDQAFYSGIYKEVYKFVKLFSKCDNHIEYNKYLLEN